MAPHKHVFEILAPQLMELLGRRDLGGGGLSPCVIRQEGQQGQDSLGASKSSCSSQCSVSQLTV